MTSTIFVVDENRAIASSMAEVLNGCGPEFQTLTCGSPYGAVQLAQAVRPNLVLMDATADPRGAVLCGLALREFYSVHVVFMTLDPVLDRILIHSLSRNGRPFPVLKKSIEPLELVKEVRQYTGNCNLPASLPNFSKETYCRGVQRRTRTEAIQYRMHR